MRDIDTIDFELRLVALFAVPLGSGVGRCLRLTWRMRCSMSAASWPTGKPFKRFVAAPQQK
jgi:hypothetical protein